MSEAISMNRALLAVAWFTIPVVIVVTGFMLLTTISVSVLGALLSALVQLIVVALVILVPLIMIFGGARGVRTFGRWSGRAVGRALVFGILTIVNLVGLGLRLLGSVGGRGSASDAWANFIERMADACFARR